MTPGMSMVPVRLAVVRELRIPWRVLIHGGRRKDLVTARHCAFWVSREIAGASYTRIALAFECDHTTVMHGVKRHVERMACDPALKARTERVAAAWRSGLKGSQERDFLVVSDRPQSWPPPPPHQVGGPPCR